jgi:hypothetical protein
MTEQSVATTAAPSGILATVRALGAFFKRNLTPKTTVAVAAWRLEGWFAGPLALFLVATLGRWTGALAMGAIMACFSAAFLFLLDGERVLDEMRGWVKQRRWGSWSMRIRDRRDTAAVAQKALAVPATIMLLGPFWRGVTYQIYRIRRPLAYVFSVGGAFPHSLFWTGVVLGGLWEIAIRPLLERMM